jgi:hypothetical protein
VPGTLSHSAVVDVAGISVRVQSNDARVIDASRARYPSADDQRAGQCNLRVVVEHRGHSEERSDEESAVSFSLRDSTHASITAPGMHAEADLASGDATLRIDEAFLASRQFRLDVLEGLVYVLLTRRDRHPVHAAAIVNGSGALLLHGPSGVGKSTLAWAAHCEGYEVLSDDSVRVQLEPSLRIWGDGTPPKVRLLENIVRADPTLRDAPRDPDGKFVVDMHDAGGKRDWRPYGESARVCLLTRGTSDVVLRPASPQEIEQAILAAPETQFDLAPEQRGRVVQRLAAPGGWSLTLSPHAEDAMPSIERMLDQLSRA